MSASLFLSFGFCNSKSADELKYNDGYFVSDFAFLSFQPTSDLIQEANYPAFQDIRHMHGTFSLERYENDVAELTKTTS